MDKLDWELPEVCAIPIDSVSANTDGSGANDSGDDSGLSSSTSG
ncbi:TPA: lasso peptide [Legionella pneumophila subsp. pneumophila]|nr:MULTISPECIES: lasso peptide [Legionella]HAT8859026.1 lasso peptide [Legionella pneumophila subsp. pneumophila]MCW8396421.1 lasso peptide [Legionella sp. PATHC039]HAT8641190.1 lasso peptide [Legionella pneumophila]HAT8890823.1 lasso peptide [Legionella pneumophila subsp. pneumophila]HAT9650386.1 lasso peptide [Legionella pneumophila subsp. pneumophila]